MMDIPCLDRVFQLVATNTATITEQAGLSEGPDSDELAPVE